MTHLVPFVAEDKKVKFSTAFPFWLELFRAHSIRWLGRLLQKDDAHHPLPDPLQQLPHPHLRRGELAEAVHHDDSALPRNDQWPKPSGVHRERRG